MNASEAKQVIFFQQIRSAACTYMRVEKMQGTIKDIFQLGNHLRKNYPYKLK